MAALANAKQNRSQAKRLVIQVRRPDDPATDPRYFDPTRVFPGKPSAASAPKQGVVNIDAAPQSEIEETEKREIEYEDDENEPVLRFEDEDQEESDDDRPEFPYLWS